MIYEVLESEYDIPLPGQGRYLIRERGPASLMGPPPFMAGAIPVIRFSSDPMMRTVAPARFAKTRDEETVVVFGYVPNVGDPPNYEFGWVLGSAFVPMP